MTPKQVGSPLACKPLAFGTKASTLQQLSKVLTQATILPIHAIEVGTWQQHPKQQTQYVQKRFGSSPIIVRSSCTAEDTHHHSGAGTFASVLNVDTTQVNAIQAAVNTVIHSYQAKLTSVEGQHVLVQPMLADVAVSGVITTCVLQDGAPYYVINYDDESGRTDTVTGGTGVNKTVFIYHGTDWSMIESERVRQWLAMAHELEGKFPQTPLDIEFAQTHDGTLYLLQVRPISASSQWNPAIAQRIRAQHPYIEGFLTQQSRGRGNLLGNRTIFTEMSDWNPAEMIGMSPRPLAASFYRHLITDSTWRTARAAMGYRHPEGEALMVMVGGRPYIDVRNSFNSFLPAKLPKSIGETLVNGWLDHLDAHPELHDKIEFDIAHTAFEFDIDTTFHQRFPNLLTQNDYQTYKDSLSQLTEGLITGNTLHRELTNIKKLTSLQRPTDGDNEHPLFALRHQLANCQKYGTFPFAVIARHAFVAEGLLRSLVRMGTLTEGRLSEFKRSLQTITHDMSVDFYHAYHGNHQTKADFIKRYGHLRPGTYDILSPRYDEGSTDLFNTANSPKAPEAKANFTWQPNETANLNACFQRNKWQLTPDEFLTYCKTAITGREYSKFVFTKTLSDMLENLADWGAQHHLSRDELSFIDIEQLMTSIHQPLLEAPETYYKGLAQSSKLQLDTARSLRLNYVVRGTRDIYVVPLQRGKPNFVTNQTITGEPIFLDTRQQERPNLLGKIVCIENADPGFDWIFTQSIAGLITKYGGSNSHMTIRCAEFQIPAAIGCGHQTFDRLVAGKQILLDPGNQQVKPL